MVNLLELEHRISDRCDEVETVISHYAVKRQLRSDGRVVHENRAMTQKLLAWLMVALTAYSGTE